jgi:ELWxxDGT repeat protein
MANYRILFNGYDSQGALQLWSTDGTDAGTVAIIPSNVGASGLNPMDIVALATVTLFAGTDSAGDVVLYSSNGTSSGTQPLEVPFASASGLQPNDITAFGSGALFAGTDSSGNQQLWYTAGTGGGTTELTLGATSQGGVQPGDITSIGTLAVFNGLDAQGRPDLYVTNGSSGGTLALLPANADAVGLDPLDITQFGNTALFLGRDNSGALGLWDTNGTLGGTSEIAAGVGDAGFLFNSSATILALGSIALFLGIGSTGNDELLVTNGTTVATILPTHDSPSGLTPTDLTALGSDALFNGIDNAGRSELWITDGSSGGTSELLPAGASSGGLDPQDITTDGMLALFSGVDSSGATGLWITNGTTGGTSEIAVTGASKDGVQPSFITADGTLALFEGIDVNGDGQLFSYDFGTGVVSEVSAADTPDFGLTPTGLTVANAICYVAGTHIRTPDGEAAIETLQPGDAVLTWAGDGGCRREVISWVGRRHVDLAGHSDPELVAPIRLRAGALGPGLPARDLLLSPDHCLALGGTLVRAYRLVNGISIVQERGWPSVEYVHVELPRHALLLAEGVPAESYLDHGTRDFFAPDATRGAPGRAESAPRPGACLPFPPDDEAVAVIWRRAGLRAPVATSDESLPGLRIAARGRVLRPVLTEGARLLYAVPPATRRLHLLSAASRPTARRPWLDDRRKLGVCVRRVVLDGEQRVALDGPALGQGWWPAEQHAGLRWTGGHATLEVPSHTRTVEIVLAS